MGTLKRAMIEDQGDPYLAVQFFKVSARFRSASITRYYTRVIVICKASDRQPSPSAKKETNLSSALGDRNEGTQLYTPIETRLRG